MREGLRFLSVALCALPAVVHAQSTQEEMIGKTLLRQGVSVNEKAMTTPVGLIKPMSVTKSEVAQNQPVEGLIVRFNTDALKALARQNLAPSTELMMLLEQTAGCSLQFERGMSGDAFVFRFSETIPWEQAEKIAIRLRELPQVELVSFNFLLQSRYKPNDPSFYRQWALAAPQVYVAGMNMEAAWDIRRGSDGAVVAVLDTGITSHPELNDRVLPGYDFISSPLISNDGNGRDSDPSDPGDWVRANECQRGSAAEDSSWHGTHLAGIIAAQGDNAQGIAGVDWAARILPVRVLGKCGGAVADIIDGMRWAAGLTVPGVPANPNPAKILNLSLGMTVPTGCSGTLFQETVNELKRRNVTVVVAAGNEDADMAYSVPASCSGVISVSALNRDGEITWYSNYNLDGLLTIAAPGGSSTDGGIYSTFNSGARAPGSASYQALAGTSMAAAHVSGVAALLKGEDPDISATMIESLIKMTSRSFPEGSLCAVFWPACGQGMLDAHNALLGTQALKSYFLVTEFYNQVTRRYFRTADQNEVEYIRATAGGRLSDTNDYFWTWRDGTSGALPVCRFYGSPGSGIESHFYTVNAHECEQVKQLLGWTYEGIAFYMKAPSVDGCPADTVPVYRFYNPERVNHRFTTHIEKRGEMQAAGWGYEGVGMCAPALM